MTGVWALVQRLLTWWFGRAAETQRAEAALVAIDKAKKERDAIDDNIGRSSDRDNRDALRKWSKHSGPGG